MPWTLAGDVEAFADRAWPLLAKRPVDDDADRVVLFADLANPTANAIYQQIGFRPVGDHRVVRFSTRESTA